MTLYSGDLRTQLRDLLTDAALPRETAESVSERLYWALWQAGSDDDCSSILAGEDANETLALRRELKDKEEEADTLSKREEDWRDAASDILGLPKIAEELTPDALLARFRLHETAEAAHTQGAPDAGERLRELESDNYTLRADLAIARKNASETAMGRQIEGLRQSLASMTAEAQRLTDKLYGPKGAAKCPDLPADAPAGQKSPETPSSPALGQQGAPAGTYGPALAAYLGRLVCPRKREFARLTADALLAGVTPNGDRPTLRAELAADVEMRVRRAVTQDAR